MIRKWVEFLWPTNHPSNQKKQETKTRTEKKLEWRGEKVDDTNAVIMEGGWYT